MLIPSDAVTPEEVYRYQTPADFITAIDFNDGLSVTCMRSDARRFADNDMDINEFFAELKRK